MKTPISPRLVAQLSLALCLLFLTGCAKTVQNGASTYALQGWVPVLVALIGVATIPIGIATVRRQKILGISLAIIGPLIAIAVVPGLFQDSVVVDKQKFISTHGFWWCPVREEIKFADLQSVRAILEPRRDRTTSDNYSLECTFKSRGREIVPLGDLMKAALPEILDRFHENGVVVQQPENLP